MCFFFILFYVCRTQKNKSIYLFSFCPLSTGCNAVLDHTDLHCMDKNSWNILQYIFFCVLQKKSYRVGTTCGWVNDRIFGCSVCLKLSSEQQWSTCFFFPYSLRYCNMHYMLCCDRMWFTIKNTLAFLNIFHMQKLHHRKICWIRGLSLSFISD